MLYKIYYPSSLTNQSLSITSNDADTITTSNGTIYRNMQIQTYTFTATGNAGYSPGNIFIDNVDQGNAVVSNYSIQKDINITVGEPTYVGIYYRHTFGFYHIMPAVSENDPPTIINYTLTTTNYVSGETSTTSDSLLIADFSNQTNPQLQISLPTGSTYEITLGVASPSNRRININNESVVNISEDYQYTLNGVINEYEDKYIDVQIYERQ